MPPRDDLDEADLLDRVRGGDHDAWQLLVLRHSGRLRRLAAILLDSRLVARIDADDVVQETLKDAFLMREKLFEDPIPFASWLRFRLKDRVQRFHRDHLATQCRSVVREVARPLAIAADSTLDPIAQTPDPRSSPSRGAMRSEEQGLLHQVFSALREIDREILSLFYFEDFKTAEIAILLELDENTVHQRHKRALSRLTSLLRREHPEWCHAFQFPSRQRA